MRFYTIPPVSALSLMDEADDIFVLAHLYYTNEAYRAFMKKKKAEGRFITLDNSAAERSLVTPEVLMWCVRDLLPDEVVAPDILFDKDATIAAFIAFEKQLDWEGLLSKTNIFFCPQGSSMQEWKECYIFGLNHPSVATIGMSKIAVPKCFGTDLEEDQGIMETRILATQELINNNILRKPLHYLGAGNPFEFNFYNYEECRSTDSCFAIWAAMCGQDWERGDKSDFERIPTPRDYFSRQLSDDQYELAVKNIRFLRKQVTDISKYTIDYLG